MVDFKNYIHKTIYLLLSLFVFSCDNDKSIEGNYSVYKYGGYLEIYFKNDSMRVAKNDEWIKLSDWQKIEIKEDTLYFTTYGEWRSPTKAKISKGENNVIELQFLDNYKNLILYPISQNIDFKNQKKFWKEFNKRSKIRNCKIHFEKEN